MVRAQRDSRGLASLKALTVVLSALSLTGLLALVAPSSPAPQTPPAKIDAALDPSTVELFVSLRLPGKEEGRRWRGTIELTDGQIIAAKAIGQGQVTVESDSAVSFEGRAKAKTKQVRKKRRKRRVRTVQPFQIQLIVRLGPSPRLALRTNHGEDSLALDEDLFREPRQLLNGTAQVRLQFRSARITSGPAEDDFPAAARGPDGTVWVVYTAYTGTGPVRLPDEPLIPDDWSPLVPEGNGDQVLLAKFDGSRWTGPWEVSDPRLDVWRPTVAVAGDGRVVVAWSQNFNGNWDVVIRTYDPAAQKWTPPHRLGGPGADIHVVATTDAAGQVWIAFQSWQKDNFDIVVFHQTQEGWSKPIVVGKSPANEWTPAIAADKQGRVFVAFDTYERGNYDVKLAVLKGGRLVELQDVAATARFEARPSVAVDGKGRVWVAYEQGGPNWGKDQGQRWFGPSGIPFYLERHIVVRVWTPDGWQETASRIPGEPRNTRYPPKPFVRMSLPRITVASDGRVWVLFRQHPLLSGAGEVWHSLATYYDGDRWAEPAPVPNTRNLLDNRPALVPLDDGALLVIHSTDYRNNTASRQQNDLFASVLPSPRSKPQPPRLKAPVDEPVEAPIVHPNEPADVARIRSFRYRVGDKEYRLLRGEFHRHTELTAHRDQDGLFESIFRYALDVAKLDWIGPGDHDNGAGHEYMWWLTQKQVDIYHHPPVFVPMFTYERSVRYPSGHRNVMFARRGIRPLPRLRGQDRLMGTPDEGAPDIKRLYAYLRHFGGICSIHTSATNMGTDWRDNDPEVEPVVEIYQGHRQNYEHYGAPYSAKGPGDSIGGYQPAGFVWNALKKGYKLGFQVSSDHVSTHLSYGVVLVEEVSRDAILEAFKARRSYGAMDNIIAVVTCGDHLMGETFRTNEKPTLRIVAHGTSPIARVSIVRGVPNETPVYVFETRPARQSIEITWTDAEPVEGKEAYYYVRIEQADGRIAWISPMWITYEP